MLDVREVAKLYVDTPLQRGRPPYIGTASGLVGRGGRLYVVADDEAAIGVFDRGGGGGRLPALDREVLPLEPARRKAQKPDLESLAALPPGPDWPGGGLLTLGSGATARRERGWLWPLDGDELSGDPLELTLSSLYEALRSELANLNIEGAAVVEDRLWLAQRGNGAEGYNALVELSLEDVARSIAADATIAPSAVRGFRRIELGSVDGVEITFSDLAPLGTHSLVFCAIAEAVESTYLDGPCVGSAVGVLDPASGEPIALEHMPEPLKIEGVTVTSADDNELELLLVADADTMDEPSPLLAARLDRPS